MATLFKKILVPHDFSEHATAALGTAAELARQHGGRLIVLHALAPFDPITAIPPGEAAMIVPPAELIATARKQLKAAADKAVGSGGPAPECRVVIGDPYQCIMEAAADADSIVMATAGRTGLAHLLIGSVTEKIVRHATVPVLTLRVTPGSRARPARRPPTARRGRPARRG
jgi:nucleotide-binding universal stress UspA family protein